MLPVRKALLWCAVLIPPIAFYIALARSLSGLPFGDDYPTILGYLLQWKTGGWIQHIVQIVTFQHNDYRCMIENAIVGAQYELLGHADLKALAILGDLLVIPLFGVLYLIWRESGWPREYTLLAFVPVSFLLFQLQYEGTLNFATSGLQCIPVVLFALLTCFLAPKSRQNGFHRYPSQSLAFDRVLRQRTVSDSNRRHFLPSTERISEASWLVLGKYVCLRDLLLWIRLRI